MALQATSAKGTIGIVLEASSGLQSALAPTAVSGTITGLAAPIGSTGCRYFIHVTNWDASGSLTVNGVGIPNNSETVSVAAQTAQQLQSAQLASFDYLTTNVYTSITNITTTGLTNAIFTVYLIQGEKFRIPVTSFKSNRKVPPYSPNEHNGFMARDTHRIATHNETDIGALDSDFYGDLSLYWIYMMCGVPTWTSLPATPTSLLSITALSSSPITGFTAPTSPGMKLILTITGYGSTPVTITINGTSYGLTTSETILVNANGTYYSTNVYSAITNFTLSATNSGASVAVTGVFGWKGVITSEGTRQTATLVFFDGSATYAHPFAYATGGSMDISIKGQAKLTMKGMAQDKIAIGDRTTNPLQTNRSASIGTPLNDMPVAGWQAKVFIDPITGTAGATQALDASEDVKIDIKTPVEAHHTFNNWQIFSRAYQIKPEVSVELTYDIINQLQYEQFRQNLKQYLVVQTYGRYLGTTGGSAYYEGWAWTLPVRYEDFGGPESEPSKGNVTAKVKVPTEYDASLGGNYQLVCYTQYPPTYNS